MSKNIEIYEEQLEKLKNIEMTHDNEENYNNLYNFVVDYEEETGNCDLTNTDFYNNIIGGVFFENSDIVHHFQCGQDKCAGTFVIDRAFWSFEALHGSIAVQAHHQDVTQLTGLSQIGDVSAVQDVEAAIGEDDFLLMQSILILQEKILRNDFMIDMFEKIHHFEELVILSDSGFL